MYNLHAAWPGVERLRRLRSAEATRSPLVSLALSSFGFLLAGITIQFTASSAGERDWVWIAISLDILGLILCAKLIQQLFDHRSSAK
jgi:hypothetical protein